MPEGCKEAVIEVLCIDIVIECVGKVGCGSIDGICRGDCRIADVFVFKELVALDVVEQTL